MRKLVFWLLCIMVFTIPWEETVTFVGIGALTRVLGYAAFLLALLSVLASGRFKALGTFHVVALTFVLWSALSFFWSVNLESSGNRAITYASLLVFVWLIWEFAEDHHEQVTLMQFFVLGLYVSMADLLLSVASGAPVGVPEYRFTGGGVNQNDLALTLAIGVPMSYYLLRESGLRSRVLRWINALYWPLSGFAIIMTGSRGGLISFGIASILTLISGYRGSIWSKVVLVLLGTVALSLAFWLLPQATSARLLGTREALVSGTWGDRTLVFAAGFRVFRDHPIIGIGSGAFSDAIDATFRGYVAHNTYLSILVEGGAIGFLLLVSLLAFVALTVWKMPKAERTCWQAVFLTWAVGVMALSWEYHKTTWFLLALAVSQAAMRQRENNRSSNDEGLISEKE